MIISTIPASNCTPQTIVIGRRGTYDTMQIAFDLSFLIKNYGSGTAVLAIKRSQDESAYPAIITQEDATLLWTVNETDTAYVGSGECQLMWYVDGGLAKTIIYPMVVMRDILATAEEPPDGYENWVEHLTELGAETQQNAQEAAQSASEAKASAEAAAESEKKAEDAADLLENVSATATTLEPGQPATAEYDEGVFKFGIPKGDKLTYADLTEADKEDLVQGPIQEAQTSAVNAVGAARVNAVNAVNGAGTTQVQNVNSAGTTNVNAVNQAGETQVGNVQTEGATQIQAVEDKGAEVIDSIPPDYSDLTAEVDDLTRHLSDLEGVVTDPTTGLDTKAPVILETASGAIASFDDGADGMPVKKLVAQIEPVQDLHGYDSPWPGGGNVNKLDIASASVDKPSWYTSTWTGTTKNQKFGITQERGYNNGGAGGFVASLTPGETYTISFDYTGSITTGCVIYVASYNGEEDTVLIDNDSMSKSGNRYEKTFTVPSDSIALCFRPTINASVSAPYDLDYIQIEVGSSATSWSPYSNICPISGHTGAEIERTGVNLFNKATIIDNAYISSSGILMPQQPEFFCSDYIPVKPETSYYLQTDTNGRLYFCNFFDINKNPIEAGVRGTITTPANCYFMTINAIKSHITPDEVFLNYPATDTAYHPYTGNQISVTFPETIYGGSDEVVSGKLKSTMGMVDLGSLNYTDYGSGIFRCSDIAGLAGSGDTMQIISSMFRVDMNLLTNKTNGTMVKSGSTAQIYFVYTDAKNAAEMKAAMSGVQLVYELATPQTYQLTPEEVTTLYGQNNIWANTGDTEVEYPCDTKLYIDGKITQAIAAALNT